MAALLRPRPGSEWTLPGGKEVTVVLVANEHRALPHYSAQYPITVVYRLPGGEVECRSIGHWSRTASPRMTPGCLARRDHATSRMVCTECGVSWSLNTPGKDRPACRMT